MSQKITRKNFFFFSIPIFSILILLASAASTAYTTYPQQGGQARNYLLGSSVFNQDLSSYTQTVKSMTNLTFDPLVGDLDGDGTNEIIVNDNGQIEIYNSTTLTLLDAMPIGQLGTYGRMSNMVLHDMTGNGNPDIVYVARTAATNHTFRYATYNGSSIVETDICGAGFPVTLPVSTVMDIILVCEDSICVAIFQWSPNQYGLYWISADNSSCFPQQSYPDYESFPQFGRVNCISITPPEGIKDYDSDGKVEVVFTSLSAVTTISNIHGDYDDRLIINRLERVNDSTLNFTYETYAVLDVGNAFNWSYPGGIDCRGSGIRDTFSQAHMQNVDGASSNGYEIVISHLQDSNETFQIDAFEYFENSVSHLDDFPELGEFPGEIVSNVVEGAFFPGSTGNDFCSVGFDSDEYGFIAVCGSKENTYFFQETMFFDSDFNYTFLRHHTNYSASPKTVHAVNPETRTASYQGGVDLNELMLPYGIFYLDPGVGFTLGFTPYYDGEASLQFGFPNAWTHYIMVDYEKSGYEDVIGANYNWLAYLNDNTTRLGCSSSNNCITEVCFNPAINTNIAKNGTQLQVTVEVVDSRDYLGVNSLSARVVAYEGNANEQDSGWSAFYPPHTIIPFNFELNSTINFGSIKVYVINDYDNTTNDTLSQEFSVGLQGQEFGESSSCVFVGGVAEEEGDTGAGITAEQEDSAKSFAREIVGVEEGDSSWDAMIGFMILAVIVGGTLMFLVRYNVQGVPVVAVPSAVGLATWILLTMFGFFPAWTVIVGIIFVGFVGALRYVFGAGTSGGG